MASVADVYAGELHDDLKVLYAVWPPDLDLKLGDYGRLDGNVFRYVGNIKDLGLTFRTRGGGSARSDYEYKSKGSVAVSFKAKAKAKPGSSVATLRAGLTVKFSADNAVFFRASACSHKIVRDKRKLGQDVMDLWLSGVGDSGWDPEYAVVTDIVEAASTTVLISKAKAAAISLEAKSAAVTAIDLADASLALTVRHEREMGIKITTAEGLQPLIGLSGLSGSFWNPFAGTRWKELDFRQPDLLRKASIGGTLSEVPPADLRSAFHFAQLHS